MKPSPKLAILLIMLMLFAGQASGGELKRIAEDSPTTRDKMLRSALLPGLGQLEQGRSGWGAAWAGGAIVLAVGTFMAYNEYNSAAVDFENAEASYLKALENGNWDLDSAREYLPLRAAAQERADERYTTRTIFQVALISWWAGNLIDVWFFERSGEETTSTDHSSLPGNLSPVVRHDAVGLSWSLDF